MSARTQSPVPVGGLPKAGKSAARTGGTPGAGKSAARTDGAPRAGKSATCTGGTRRRIGTKPPALRMTVDQFFNGGDDSIRDLRVEMNRMARESARLKQDDPVRADALRKEAAQLAMFIMFYSK